MGCPRYTFDYYLRVSGFWEIMLAHRHPRSIGVCDRDACALGKLFVYLATSAGAQEQLVGDLVDQPEQG
jgi:hypothetical protein